MRPTLCLPTDVIRRFDPQIPESDLRNVTQGSPIGRDDYETIVSKIEGVESKLRAETGRPYLRRQEGDPDAPETWTTPMSVDWDRSRPVAKIFCTLPDDEVIEILGIEFRDSFDTFHTVDLDNVSLNPNQGTLSIRRGVLPSGIWNWISHEGYNVRVAYTYGARGGSDGRAGQTTLTEQVDDTTGTVDVENETRLPPSGGTMLLEDEYVGAEVGDGQVDLVERGLRGTSASSHDSGDTLHYCPINVREGVAAKAAMELVTVVDKIDEAVGEQFNPSEKREVWEAEWSDIKSTSGAFSTL